MMHSGRDDSTQTVLRTSGLTKRFGRLVAVDGLDLTIDRGQVFGILGPNGSGKTTTLGMILGVVRPTEGSFSWFEKGDAYALRKRIGAILEQPACYPFLNALDNLRVTALIKDVRSYDAGALLRLTGLYDRRHDTYGTYSYGMKQRLAIACALVGDPEVLIFDEPTNGLDPQGIADIRRMILEIASAGKTILLASHLLDEVQKVCSHFCVLQRGRRIYQGSVSDILQKSSRIEVAARDLAALERAMKTFGQVSEVYESGGVLIAHADGLSTEEINRFLIAQGIVVTHLAQVRSSLEEQFLSILSEDGA